MFNKLLDAVITFFVSLICPTFSCSQEQLDKMMVKKGYRKGYAGHWVMPDDIILDEEYRA